MHCWRVDRSYSSTRGIGVKCNFAKVKQILYPVKCRIVLNSLKEHMWEENTSLPIPWKCSRPNWMKLWEMWSSGNHSVILWNIERWWKIRISKFFRNWERNNLPQTLPITRNVLRTRKGMSIFRLLWLCLSLKLTSQCSGACPWHKQGGLRWPRQRAPTHSGQLCAARIVKSKPSFADPCSTLPLLCASPVT